MEIALAVIFLGIGGALGWLLARNKFTAERQQDYGNLLIEQEKSKNLHAQLEDTRRSLEAERQKVMELNNTLASTEADYRNLEEKLAERKKEIDTIQEKFTAEFKNLANEILEKNSAKFTDLNKS